MKHGALELGLVDEVVPPDDVAPRAVAWCERLLKLPAQAVAQTRALAREPLVRAFDILDDAHVESFLDLWFSDETRGAGAGPG